MRYFLIALMLVGCSSPVATVATVAVKPKVYKPSELVAMKEKLPEGMVEVKGTIYKRDTMLKITEEEVSFALEDDGIRTTDDSKNIVGLLFTLKGSDFSPQFKSRMNSIKHGYYTSIRAKGYPKLFDGIVVLADCEMID